MMLVQGHSAKVYCSARSVSISSYQGRAFAEHILIFSLLHNLRSHTPRTGTFIPGRPWKSTSSGNVVENIITQRATLFSLQQVTTQGVSRKMESAGRKGREAIRSTLRTNVIDTDSQPDTVSKNGRLLERVR